MKPHPCILALFIAAYAGNALSQSAAPTEVCFRRLEWVGADGRHNTRLEIVMMRSSGVMYEDARRMATLEEKDSFASNSHTRPNVWRGARLWAEENDFTNGPTCRKFPTLSVAEGMRIGQARLLSDGKNRVLSGKRLPLPLIRHTSSGQAARQRREPPCVLCRSSGTGSVPRSSTTGSGFISGSP